MATLSPCPLPLSRTYAYPSPSPRPLPPLAFSPRMSSDPHPRPPSSASIPQMEPFNRSRLSRLIREPSLLEKAEHALSDRCMILEGDDAYRCWEALFEFENLKEECKVQCDVAPSAERPTACRPLERLESLVRQSNGVASLIDNVRMLAKTTQMRKAAAQVEGQVETPATATEVSLNDTDGQDSGRHVFPEPGCLPPTEEELELERSAMMPESPFTRVLRRMGSPSLWFTQPPGLETA